MIYTVTLNPSIDYLLFLEKNKDSGSFAKKDEMLIPGGKGINVSAVLHCLKTESVCLGFIAGFIGSEIRRKLEDLGCKTDFTELSKGCSRMNIKFRTSDQKESEINGKGPMISKEAAESLKQKLIMLKSGDMVIFSGSLAPGLPENFYQQCLFILKGKEILSIVDTSGEALRLACKARPYLIKPNWNELERLFNTTFTKEEEAIAAAKQLQKDGAKNILISHGEHPAVFINEFGKVYYQFAPKGTVQHTLGAGDAMVAGFAAALARNFEFKERLLLSTAAGSATAFTKGLANREEILSLYQAMGGTKQFGNKA